MALDTLDLLDGLGWTSNVHIAGVSMGGMISLELVLADPKRFSSLLLTSTNAGRSPPQLVTISFLSRVILIKDPQLRMKLIAETLYPKVIKTTFHVEEQARGKKIVLAEQCMLRGVWRRKPVFRQLAFRQEKVIESEEIIRTRRLS